MFSIVYVLPTSCAKCSRRYFGYSRCDFQVFGPAGAMWCIDGVKFGVDESTGIFATISCFIHNCVLAVSRYLKIRAFFILINMNDFVNSWWNFTKFSSTVTHPITSEIQLIFLATPRNQTCVGWLIAVSQWPSGNMPDCGVIGPRFESHRTRLCLSRQPLRYTALGTGCTPLLQCLGWLSLPPSAGR